MKKLIVNENFKPYLAKSDDEVLGGFPFAWNISELEKWLGLHSDKVVCSTVKVSPTSLHMVTLTEAHIPTVDLSKPVIAVRNRPDMYRLIDGQHRVEKARRNGLAELPAYYINEIQHRQFFIHPKADQNYVDYYNEKFKTGEKYGTPDAVIGDLEV
ncbi:ParB N-terminal domain-containing protein [Sporosarcina sp. FA9]|uniref:ParB N-terminal domain-containing protein n=1 Tax=Sporosarcina sp. FA9 TaxID=3413030 RepID=UPI003F65B3D7